MAEQIFDLFMRSAEPKSLLDDLDDGMIANIVPVWSMTKSNVMGGDEGSRPSSFSATKTYRVVT
jgi:hypothetical protein